MHHAPAKNSHVMLFSILLILTVAGDCSATGSGIVWIPSTYVQPFTVVRLGIDNYFSLFRKSPAAGGIAFPTDIGVTMGMLPPSFPVGLELGVDLMEPTDSPWSVNAKFGIGEHALFTGAPALAAGVASVGFKKDVTDYNILFGVASKVIPGIGRITGGYYSGNKRILRDLKGIPNQHGFMAAWDRPLPELSEHLVLAVDYQDGTHAFGAFNIGATWNFTPTIGVMVGYNFYNDGYFPDTFTTQLDIDI